MRKILAVVCVAALIAVLAVTCSAASTKTNASFDRLYVNGSDSFLFNGGAAAYFAENTLEDEYTSFRVFGWGYFVEEDEAIESFGYQIDEGSPVWVSDSALYDAKIIRPTLPSDNVQRFDFTADVSGVGAGEHTFTIWMKATSGLELSLDRSFTFTQKLEAAQETPISTEKSPDQWLCGEDPGAATQPGWWFNPVGQPDDRYVEVKFTAEGYFSGVHGFYYCSNPDGFPDLGLAYAHMTLQLIKDGKVVAEKEMTPVGDNWYDVDFGKSFEPGEYSLKYSCRDGSGIENNCWCVIGYCGGSGSTTVEANVNAPTAGSYPALMLIGSTPEGTPAPTSDAAVIAIAAVGCIALAGVVVAKKVK